MLKEISKKWYAKLCEKRVDKLLENESVDSIANVASVLSYRSSITRALYKDGKLNGFKGISKQDKENARQESALLISNYLTEGFNSEFDMNNVYELMSKVRDIYHNHGVDWYTYGNAQKFVSMSFKYFFVILDHFNIVSLDGNDVFKGYNYSVVDGIIIKNERNVHFNSKSWSRCDTLDVFKQFQSELNEEYKNDYTNLFYYELEGWNE